MTKKKVTAQMPGKDKDLEQLRQMANNLTFTIHYLEGKRNSIMEKKLIEAYSVIFSILFMNLEKTSHNIQTSEGAAYFLIDVVSHSDDDDSVMENLRYVFDTCKQCNLGLTVIQKKPICGICRIDLNYVEEIDIIFYTKSVIDTVNEETLIENMKVLYHHGLCIAACYDVK